MNPTKTSLWISLFQLGRFQSPFGAGLLFWPCMWGLTVSSDGLPPWKMLWVFALGALLARGGGCVYNDWVDRDIDRCVTRTRNRPLASGKLASIHALSLLLFCAASALALCLCLPPKAQVLSCLFAVLVIPYPWLKRITFWPQIYLGILFSGGVWVGSLAAQGKSSFPWITLSLLYGVGIFWTLAYDTIYAYQDQSDDRDLGLKSTAVFWGGQGHRFLQVCWLGMILSLMGVGFSESFSFVYYLSLLPLLGHLLWQNRTLCLTNPDQCLRLFQSNQWIGLGVSLSLMIGTSFARIP